jgi:hypothetical protein
VAVTAEDIIIGAYGFSTKNRPDQIATKAAELLDLVGRALRGLFSVGALVNPEFYSKQANVAFAAGGWPRPADAELIWRIETPLAAEVVVVPRSDRAAEPGKPALYVLGQKFYGAGNALDPVAGNLAFFYSVIPAKPATLATVIDPLFPAHFDSLLMHEVAIYLALKDGRSEEVGGLVADRDKWLQLYVSFLEHETVNRVFRYGSTRTYNLPELRSLLAGATAE